MSEKAMDSALRLYREAYQFVEEEEEREKAIEKLGEAKKHLEMGEEQKESKSGELLSEILNFRGGLLRSLERFEESAADYEEMLKLNEKLLKTGFVPENSEKYEFGAVTALNALGIVYLFMRKYGNAGKTLEKAMDINEKLLEIDPEYSEYRIIAAETFENYANLLKEIGRFEEAEEYFTRAEEIYDEL